MAKKVKVLLECIWFNGRYPKIVHPRDKDRPKGEPREYLRFRNGRATVEQEFFEHIKDQDQYGSEFALLGKLAKLPTKPKVQVVQGPIASDTASSVQIPPQETSEGEV
jgi:hypothetical protein